MARRPRQAAARGPAAVAVHDDRHVKGSTLFHKAISQKKEPSTSACPTARRADQRFHVIEVALERPPSESGESVFGLGHATRERLVAGDVLGVFELARVHAEI